MNINYSIIAKSLRGGLFTDFDADNTPSTLVYLYNKCQINEIDDLIDKVFKSLVITGNIMDATKYINQIGCRTEKNRKFIPTDISDCIFYKQSSDVEITILAKFIYSYTCQNKGFLQWQIYKLIKDGSFNYDEESNKYQLYCEAKDILYEYIENIHNNKTDILHINLINDYPKYISHYSCSFNCEIFKKDGDINSGTIYLSKDEKDMFKIDKLEYNKKTP